MCGTAITSREWSNYVVYILMYLVGSKFKLIVPNMKWVIYFRRY